MDISIRKARNDQRFRVRQAERYREVRALYNQLALELRSRGETVPPYNKLPKGCLLKRLPTSVLQALLT